MSDARRLPGPVADLWEWQFSAACRALPSEMFFHPEGERGSARAQRERRAKAVCAACPVRRACESHAMAAREPYGIWGGLGEHERSERLGPARSAAC
ncbi:MAG: WhiB family transcriptional regulator, redox-sensing transcriptional regulator [Frankiaceae bacterium]|jgi:WhiB family redox-sensing transcriptional regulator|nr:WhiB family transcriptional regulator, redox-sensing transcriptional regulator [Frankiaceae bacterium]MDX6225913.1 WhiB family transcriptional regulator, redox-sensing transcriptional regulator [Frankiales bacterium]MDX6275170.1 WhiB family transcriptional regulator, redox-sensing transcriptional regulator [Frankiales bacterium]